MTVVDFAIPRSAPVNLRDLGGIPVSEGVVREGFAIRADDLSIVTDDAAGVLVARGLRAVVDLRSPAEVGITGRGPLGDEASVGYHHVPLMASVGEGVRGLDLEQPSFERMYVRMIEEAASQIVTAMAIVAYAPGTVAFHCAAGQDRTGVLAASILLALGADDDAIVADYERTGQASAEIMTRIAPIMQPLLSSLGMDLDAHARAATRSTFSPAPMRGMLRVLGERHGDSLAPLRAAGLDDGLVARLRSRAIA